MILVMSDELGRVERVLNTSILVNTDLVQTYRTTLFVMMFVDYLFDSLISDADHYFFVALQFLIGWFLLSYCFSWSGDNIPLMEILFKILQQPIIQLFRNSKLVRTRGKDI